MASIDDLPKMEVLAEDIGTCEGAPREDRISLEI